MQAYAEITKSHVWPNGVVICFPETPIIFPFPAGVSKKKWGHVEWGDVAAENTSLCTHCLQGNPSQELYCWSDSEWGALCEANLSRLGREML